MAKWGVTKGQAEVARVLSEIVFKGIALFVVLALLVIGFLAFIYALFRLDKPVSTGILGGVDLLLGFLLRQVYGSLFPTKSN
jgi:membrane-bound ClpP family serine protease